MGWISVQDRLPDVPHHEIWICDENGTIELGYYRYGRWTSIYCDGDGDRESIYTKVISWMPLQIPDPPKVIEGDYG